MDSKRDPTTADETARLVAEIESLRDRLRRRERDLEVESALDVVRERATAMTTSSELSDASAVLFQQFQNLGIRADRASVGIFDDPSGAIELWTTFSSAHEEVKMLDYVSVYAHPVLENAVAAREQGRPYALTVLRGDQVPRFYEMLSTDLRLPEGKTYSENEFHYSFFFPDGMLTAISHEAFSDEECSLMERFARAFGLMYRRFRDLQLSEANARDALRDASINHIRAEVASMRSRNDLERITPLVWRELTTHGVALLRCGVFIMDEESRLVRTFLSTPDGRAIAQVNLPYDLPFPLVSEGVPHWRSGLVYTEYWDAATFTEFWGYLASIGAIDETPVSQPGQAPPDGLFLHLVPFQQGMLYVGSTGPLDDEDMRLLQSLAEVFTTAYARFEDFSRLEAAKEQVERSLSELKETQAQLVHAEKMASLGEVTAGIAHEIKNPLNFVNNFADVARELIVEMEDELDRGDHAAARDLARSVADNLERIGHHGRRADAIVKGMLQLSRDGSGEKVPTDLNALAEEYARLAYHGLRAVNPTFQASVITEFDPAVGLVDVVPQDMGRVLLNLLSNAFYAVSERSPDRLSVEHEPTVWVSTSRRNGFVAIQVRDNGDGIPNAVLEKIFQPFFTTKPSGQGTGLGLSLSYEIVTRGHGGELSVTTDEGEGTEFIVRIPVAPA